MFEQFVLAVVCVWIGALLCALAIRYLRNRRARQEVVAPEFVPESLGLDRFTDGLPPRGLLRHPDVVKAARAGGMTVSRVVALHDEYIDSRGAREEHVSVCSICQYRGVDGVS